MKLIELKTGRVLQVGDQVETFRGIKGKLEWLEPPKHSASSGKIYFSADGWTAEYFPQVIGARFVE